MINQIITGIADHLKEGAPEGTLVHRHALRPIEKDKLPALVPFLLEMQPRAGQGVGNPLRQYDAKIRVECRATGEPMEAALEPLILHVQRKFLEAPPCLGGWAINVTEGQIQFDAMLRDEAYAAAALDFDVHIVYTIAPEGSDTEGSHNSGLLQEAHFDNEVLNRTAITPELPPQLPTTELPWP
jgi:hypothetical protein